jgi:hypothetical protein
MKKLPLLIAFSTVITVTSTTVARASQQPIALPTASIADQNPLASLALSLLPKELQAQIGKIEQDATKAGLTASVKTLPPYFQMPLLEKI